MTSSESPRYEYAVNPLQWIATDDGWIDAALAPSVGHQLDVIAGAGFHKVQPSIPPGLSASEYREALARHALTAGPGYFVARLPAEPLEMSPSERARIIEESRTTARQLAEVGSDVVFLGLGMVRDAPRVLRTGTGENFDRGRLELISEVIADVSAALASESGLSVALHPHAGTWIETEFETRYVLESVDENVLGFGPDIGHLYWAGADPRALMEEFGHRLAGVHLKDYDKAIATQARREGWGYQRTVMAGIWREPGTGDEDLVSILSSLPSTWGGTVVVEVDRAAVESPEKSIRMCGDWVARNRPNTAPGLRPHR